MVLLSSFFFSCKKDEDNEIKSNTVQSLLSTSSTAFDNASSDIWVEITEEEYIKLSSELPNITKIGAQDSEFGVFSSASFGTGYSHVFNASTSKEVIIPNNDYIFAFKIDIKSTAISGLRILASSTSNTTGFEMIGNVVNATGSSTNETYYFVMKSTVQNKDNTGYVGFYSGGGGTSTAATTGSRYYLQGIATSTSNFSGPTTVGGIPVLQFLSSPKIKW